MNKIELFNDEIVSIEEYDIVDTIDITVDDTHMFFANDIYTHNSGFNSEFIDAQQSGGSIKRIQKAHFFMSVAKTQEQKESQLPNISILKARFAQDGQKFEDCIFNNDTMKVIIEDSRYKYSKTYKNLKHYTEEDKIKFDKKIESIQSSSYDIDAADELNKLLLQNRNNSNVDSFELVKEPDLDKVEIKKVNFEYDISNDDDYDIDNMLDDIKSEFNK